jgi:hypothetical protein
MCNLLKLKFKIIWIYIKYNMGMLFKSYGVSTFFIMYFQSTLQTLHLDMVYQASKMNCSLHTYFKYNL